MEARKFLNLSLQYYAVHSDMQCSMPVCEYAGVCRTTSTGFQDRTQRVRERQTRKTAKVSRHKEKFTDSFHISVPTLLCGHSFDQLEQQIFSYPDHVLRDDKYENKNILNS